MTRVVVVGGGITGLASAAACARAGLEVTLIERGAFGDGFAPLASVAPPADEHFHVWRMSSHAFHLDRDTVDVIVDGEVTDHRHTVDPAGLIGAWAGECRRLGVTLDAATPALGLVRFGGAVSGVETHRATISADEVVLAAGVAMPRFLAGTPGDVVLASRRRPYLLVGPAPERLPGIVEAAGLRLIQDTIGRVLIEGIGDPREALGAVFPDLARLAVLEAGESRLTITPDGEPLLRRPAWITGVTLLCAGSRPLDDAPRLGARLAAGLTTGSWA